MVAASLLLVRTGPLRSRPPRACHVNPFVCKVRYTVVLILTSFQRDWCLCISVKRSPYSIHYSECFVVIVIICSKGFLRPHWFYPLCVWVRNLVFYSTETDIGRWGESSYENISICDRLSNIWLNSDALSSTQNVLGAERDVKIITNSEHIRIWKDTIVVCFRVRVYHP